MTIEEPKFIVLFQEPPFEVRDYASVVVAEVAVAGDMGNVSRNGFRQLAGYIFGGNSTRKRIAMTAPVTIIPNGATSPAAWAADTADTSAPWAVRFTMPSAYALSDLPQPENAGVQLKSLPAGRFAVLRFSGFTGKARLARQTDRLIQFVAKHQLTAIGSVALARYDPPWTLWFLRRNEVMVAVDKAV